MPTRRMDDQPGLIPEIRRIAQEARGIVAVAARHLGGGHVCHVRSAERFPAASVIKIAILVELMARVKRGEVALEETLRLEEQAKTPGSGVLSMLHPGLELTLGDVAHLMITVSDNTASNMLIDRLGCDNINATLTGLGLHQTRLERKFYDLAAREQGLDNWIAAGELADLLARIELRQVVSPDACERILAIMRRQQFDNRIPKLLPPDTVVANKTGTITGVCHDAGIIYSPAGPLVLVVLTRGIAEVAVAEDAIRRIARLVYDRWGTRSEQ